MLLEITTEHLGALRRALEARARDMQLRLASEPGDEGYQREAALVTQLLRQVEATERRVGHVRWGADESEFESGTGEN
jgi:hypothetical protein